MDSVPSLFERVAYRSLGIRLDDRWRSWVEQDLGDPRWLRRHRMAQVATFSVLGLLGLAAMGAVLGKTPWYGSGGFLGALFGQLLFGDLKRRQWKKAHLSPQGPPISGPLGFPHRVVLAAATMVLLFGVMVATAFAIRVDDRPCKIASSFATAQLARSVVPSASLVGGIGHPIEDDVVEIVAFGILQAGREREVGVWAVRGDGDVVPLNEPAARVTTPSAVGVSFGQGVDVAEISAALLECG